MVKEKGEKNKKEGGNRKKQKDEWRRRKYLHVCNNSLIIVWKDDFSIWNVFGRR